MNDTSADPKRILLLEDDEGHAELAARAFRPLTEQYAFTVVDGLTEARRSIAETVPDIIIADMFLVDGMATDLMSDATVSGRIPVIVITSQGDEQMAVDAMKSGALDYVVKSEMSLSGLPTIVARSLREWGYIVECRHAEEALRESEKKYRLLIESQTGLVVKVGLDGRFRFASPRYCQTFGVVEEELRDCQTWAPLDGEAGSESLAAITHPPYEAVMEQRAMTPQGWRWFSWSASAVVSEDGEPTDIVGVGEDVTERRRQELTEQALHHVWEAGAGLGGLEDILAVVRDELATLLDADDYLVTLFENGDGTPASAADQKTDAREVSDRLSAWVRRAGTSALVELDAPDSKTSSAYGIAAAVFGDRSWIAAPLIGAGGTIGAIVVKGQAAASFSKTDLDLITLVAGAVSRALERKTAELKLLESERRFRLIFEHSSDAIVWMEADSTLIIDCNRAAEQLTGKDRRELLWKRREELFPSITDTKLRQALAGRSDDGLEIRTGDGQGRYVSLSASEAEVAGKPIIQAVLSDVTETRRLRETAHRAQRLETAGRIAGQVAHDFNNLLGPLVAYPGIIKEELPEGHSCVKLLESIERSAEQMAEVNQQLLTLGRRGHYNLAPLNINDVVADIARDLRIRPQTLTVKVELDESLLNVAGGEAQIHRVFSNLVTNARDAMQDMGTLTLATENCYVDEVDAEHGGASPGEYVKATISDTGCGITEEAARQVFDPFFTTKKPGERRGSGLGLSVVHSVVKDHDGFINLQSEVGKGSVFEIYLPVSRQAVDYEAPEEMAGGSENILVVDDDPVQREVSKRLLDKLGYSVTAVESGEMAVEELSRKSYDLMLLDMVMPSGIDGTETYRRALALDHTPRAIIVSGYAESDRVRVAQELGVGEYVRKPLKLAALASAVRRELDRVEASAAVS